MSTIYKILIKSWNNSENTTIALIKYYPIQTGLLIRILIATFFPLLLDKNNVKYTDIDYNVFTDAAIHVNNNNSPYERHTYRYTPFLAMILSLFGSKECIWIFSRYLFCLLDTVCGYLIHVMRLEQREKQNYGVINNNNELFYDALWWLYNPLAINICTRGSAESFIILTPVLLSIYIATRNKSNIFVRCVATGIFHGISIHMKIYPIIYTVSFMSYFSRTSMTEKDWNSVINDKDPSTIKSLSFLKVWIKRLLRLIPLLFLTCSLATFIGLTYLSYYLYGYKALYEGLLYHLFYRMDHRHNYSIHWYWIYLLLERESDGSMDISSLFAIRILKVLLIVPPAIIYFVLSIGLAPHDIHTTLFLQTYLFVCWNKVCTGQYFTWFLCLLPLCNSKIITDQSYKQMLFIGISILFWLCNAYFLEIDGRPFHLGVWVGSVIFFVMNINFICGMLCNYGKSYDVADDRGAQKKHK